MTAALIILWLVNMFLGGLSLGFGLGYAMGHEEK